MSVMKRAGPIERKPLKRPRPRPTGPSAEVVDLVYERAQHSCEVGGCMVGDLRGIDHHIHHRRPRRSGGDRRPDTNSPANLLLVCPPHHDGIESRRAVAYRMGWLLASGATPAAEPVLLYRDGQAWHLLDHQGKAVSCPAPARGIGEER